jgi:argininosuccinate lyase
MPQKKNPDVPELARGKTGRVYGYLIALLTHMKSQPLAYNKDNQEDKEPLFDAADTLLDTLRIFADLVPHIVVNAPVLLTAAEQGFSTATDLADYLVKKGLPFRDAHEAVALAVKTCVNRSCALDELTLAELQSACGLQGQADLLTEDVFALLQVQGSVEARAHLGGTAPKQVLAAIQQARADLVD